MERKMSEVAIKAVYAHRTVLNLLTRFFHISYFGIFHAFDQNNINSNLSVFCLWDNINGRNNLRGEESRSSTRGNSFIYLLDVPLVLICI
jgi:hypothetical protein